MVKMQKMWKNVGWGITGTLAIVAVCVIWISVIEWTGGNETIEEIGFWTLVGIYLFGGLLAGTVLGLLRPILSKIYGAILAGILITAVGVMLVWPFTDAFEGWTAKNIVAGVAVSLLVGFLWGVAGWWGAKQ